jgi:hypothetical protein
VALARAYPGSIFQVHEVEPTVRVYQNDDDSSEERLVSVFIALRRVGHGYVFTDPALDARRYVRREAKPYFLLCSSRNVPGYSFSPSLRAPVRRPRESLFQIDRKVITNSVIAGVIVIAIVKTVDKLSFAEIVYSIGIPCAGNTGDS